MQTKYTALLLPAVVLLHALLFGRWRLGLSVAALAGLVFVAWEGWVAWTYGESHFLYHARLPRSSLLPLRLALPLVSTLGGVAPGLGLLGLAALGVRRRGLLLAGLLAALVYAAVALVPGPAQVLTRSPDGLPRLQLAGLLYGLSGAFVVVVLVRVVAQVGRFPTSPTVARESWFLLLWLAGELAAYFLLSPFPAARRVMGLTLVSTLLAGRLAVRACRDRALVRGVALASVVLGLGFAGLDLWEARTQKQAVEQAARWVRRENRAGRPVWYAGICGMQFYAERAGLRRLLPGCAVGPGEWLVLDEHCAALLGDKVGAAPWGVLALDDGVPLRTLDAYYGTATPLEHRAGPRRVLTIYHRAR
jgi:hypothetical protein